MRSPLLCCLFYVIRKGSSSIKSPEEGYFQEGNSYSHEGSLLPPQDSFPCPKAQVPEEEHPHEVGLGQVLHHQVPPHNRVIDETH